MLFGRNEVPFPENPHCKRCASKNCRELLVQPLFPGKVIFVHRRHFCSNPDYIPSWRNEEDTAPVKETALTDELEIVSGPVTVKNPRWEHKDENKKENSADTASFGDTIILMADVTGMPEGSGITFDIYETSENPPMCVASAKGKITNGIGKGEWVVTDKSGKGEESKLAFEGIAKSKASVRCEITIEVVPAEFEVTLSIDPDDPTTYDDKVFLKGIDSDYEQVKTILDDKVPGDGLLTIAFSGVTKNKKYTLIHDDGQERHVIFEETVYGG